MKSLVIKLDTINDVKNFVNIVSKYDFDVDLVSGRYAVDAKSIMGIFSLDLAKSIKMEIYSDDCAAFLDEVKDFSVDKYNLKIGRKQLSFPAYRFAEKAAKRRLFSFINSPMK